MPDTILYNARISTLDERQPTGQALAIRGAQILAVGSNTGIRSLAGGQTRQIDLGGMRVLPGLQDSHFHFYDWSLGRANLALAGIRSKADLLSQLAKRVQSTPPSTWILGQGWNETDWEQPSMPLRGDLDMVAPAHPVLLWRSDLHLAVANSTALQLAGIDKNTPSPADGVIDRDERGSPTGILRELAINLVSGVKSQPTVEEAANALVTGGQALHRLGLTRLHDFRLMGGPESVAMFTALQHLQAEQALNIRVWMNLPGERLVEATKLGLRTGFGDDFLRVGHVKFFTDGSQGARTAWMLEPYLDTGECGLPLTSMEEIEFAVNLADQSGLAVAVHAIGDRANRELINVFERVLLKREENIMPPAAPHRIEHVQNARAEDLQRLGRLNVFASVQPIHAIDDYPMIEASVGERARFSYPFRSMLAQGIPLALGSDAPVADPNPFLGIHAAVTRQRRSGAPAGGWYREQCLTVDEAIWGYTQGASRVTGSESRLGTLTPGKLADLVVLDRDIFQIEPADIPTTKVVMTMLGGKIVYES